MIKWFNDNTFEVVLAYLRGVALLLPAVSVIAWVAAVWAPDVGTMWRLILTGVLLTFIGSGAATIGFWMYGNEEWRPKRGDAER